MWKENEPLYRHTTFRIGGCAAFYCRPANLHELKQALRDAHEFGLPVRLLGGGSNLIIDDNDLNIAVIHIAYPCFSEFRITGDRVYCGAGVRLATFLKQCAKRGLGGLEALAGIPGTLGGAVADNAGANGVSIADRIVSVTVLDGKLRQVALSRSDLRFGYRSSEFNDLIITGIEFQMVSREPRDIVIELTRLRERKLTAQPVWARSAGCVFKNPNGDSAGRLIDMCGLKGTRVGGAEVSEKHANFIINRENASASDVLNLVGHIQNSVRRLFQVELEMEIEHWAA